MNLVTSLLATLKNCDLVSEITLRNKISNIMNKLGDISYDINIKKFDELFTGTCFTENYKVVVNTNMNRDIYVDIMSKNQLSEENIVKFLVLNFKAKNAKSSMLLRNY